MAVGTFGLGLVLKTLLDEVFLDWDFSVDFRKFVAENGPRTRYVQVYNYDVKSSQVKPRLIPVRTPLPQEIRLVEAAAGVPRQRAQTPLPTVATAPGATTVAPLPLLPELSGT